MADGAFEEGVPLYFAFSIVLSLIFVLVSRSDPAPNLLAWAHAFLAQVLSGGTLIAYAIWRRPGASAFAFFFAMASSVLLLDAAERFRNTRHSRSTLSLLAIAGAVSVFAFSSGDHESGIVLTLAFRSAVLFMASWLLWKTASTGLVGLRISTYTLQLQGWFNLGCVVAFLYFSSAGTEIPHGELAPFAFLLLDVVLALGLVLATTERAREALAVANQDLLATRAQLETVADTDPLTGCFNRRVFRALVERRQTGNESTGALFLIDIDDLKAVNDTQGHPAGDALIRNLADAVRRRVRSDELVIRWGGDEFLVVLGGLSPWELDARKAAIEESIADAGLTASIGAATFGRGVDILTAVEEADRAMYGEKKRRKGSAA